MADRIFFVGSSPEDFAGGYYLPEEMVSDLLELVNLSPEIVDQVANALADADGFLDEAGVEKLVLASVPDAKTARSVCNVVQNLRPTGVGPTLEKLRQWRKGDDRRAERLPDASLTTIELNLPRLVRPFPAIERQRKARRLLFLTGNQARQIDIVCDCRPVFDADRRSIEGFVTLTTLRLGYETQAEQNGCIEVQLSPAQIKELLEKAEKAQRKIEVMRESIQDWIPGGSATVED